MLYYNRRDTLMESFYFPYQTSAILLSGFPERLDNVQDSGILFRRIQ
jgi:hypothetical protein